MKKNDKRIDRVYSFFNAIRGNNTPNEYQSVLAVLKKVMVLQDCAQNEMDYDELYQLMESVATDFEIPNPFPEKERFVDIYRTLQGFDELSWTDILEYGDDRSKFRVPESVVDEMEKNFIDGFQEVLIAEAEKFSPFLERLVEAHFDSHFTLTTIDAFYYKVLNEMFDDNDMVDIKQTNIYQYEFTSEKFDLILSVPVFGVRDKADESSEFICREYDMIAAENLALHLRSEGILSIVLPAKITFAGGTVKELREFLQSMYCLKEISDLPSGIFDNTGVKTFLLTITTGRTDEVTIKRFVFEDENARKTGNKKIVVQDDTFVLEDELTDMGDWNVDRIFEEQTYPCIASSNVIVIRATDESLSTTYLKLFFDSPLGRKMLVTRQQGTAVMNISYKELNNIEIPLPSIEEQRSIAEEYTRELEVYKKAIQEAENRWTSTLSRLQARI